MAALKPRGRTLAVGDKVRIVKNTRFWAGHPRLQDLTGRVTRLVDDDMSMRRIVVVFDNHDPVVGVDEGLFEKVAP